MLKRGLCRIINTVRFTDRLKKWRFKSAVVYFHFLHEKFKVCYCVFLTHRLIRNRRCDAGDRSHLDWTDRVTIALQSAYGLEYLHNGCQPKILHRDIKSENILLTGRMIATVADFGICKVGSDQDNIPQTHVSTMVKGTRGYIDPEYFNSGRFTDKSDVFSFGILLYEIVTGRKPIKDGKHMIEWVKGQKGKAIADPMMEGNFNPKAFNHSHSTSSTTRCDAGDRSHLDWTDRVTIALQSAYGLEYLHNGCQPKILHRDIKSENILLTGRMIATVADFGICKVGSDQDNIPQTHVSTMVKGTRGYIDPEYFNSGRFTDKSDVFSFGILLYEIVTGRKPIKDGKHMIEWVKGQKGKAIADPMMEGNFNPKALNMVVSIAKQCTHLSSAKRPDMKKVVRLLEAAQAANAENKLPWLWFKPKVGT